jgi:hypothetical protein
VWPAHRPAAPARSGPPAGPGSSHASRTSPHHSQVIAQGQGSHRCCSPGIPLLSTRSATEHEEPGPARTAMLPPLPHKCACNLRRRRPTDKTDRSAMPRTWSAGGNGRPVAIRRCSQWVVASLPHCQVEWGGGGDPRRRQLCCRPGRPSNCLGSADGTSTAPLPSSWRPAQFLANRWQGPQRRRRRGAAGNPGSMRTRRSAAPPPEEGRTRTRAPVPRRTTEPGRPGQALTASAASPSCRPIKGRPTMNCACS